MTETSPPSGGLLPDAEPAPPLPHVVPGPARGRIIRNVRSLAVAEVATRLIAALTGLAVARLLGPSLLGAVVLAQTIVTSLGSLTDGGMTILSQRQVVLERDRASQILTATTIAQLFIAAVITVVIVTLGVVAPVSVTTSTLLLAFAPYSVVWALNLVYALQALERMKAVAVARIAGQAVNLAITVGLVALTHNPLWVAVGVWGGLLVTDVIALALLRSGSAVRFVKVPLSHARDLLRRGVPLLGTLALYQYVAITGVVVLGLFKTSADVGFYGAAAQLAIPFYGLSQVLINSSYPEMVRRFPQGREHFAAFVTNIERVGLRSTLVATSLLVAQAGPIITLLFGEPFAPAAGVLQAMIVWVPLGWFAVIASYALLATGDRRTYLEGFIAWAAIATVAIVPATLLWGAAGAAIGIQVGVCGQAFLVTRALHRHTGHSMAPAALRELPYGLVPLFVLGGLGFLVPGLPLYVMVPIWAVVVLAVEVAHGMPTIHGLRHRGGRSVESLAADQAAR